MLLKTTTLVLVAGTVSAAWGATALMAQEMPTPQQPAAGMMEGGGMMPMMTMMEQMSAMMEACTRMMAAMAPMAPMTADRAAPPAQPQRQ